MKRERMMSNGFATISLKRGPETTRITVEHWNHTPITFCLTPHESTILAALLLDLALEKDEVALLEEDMTLKIRTSTEEQAQ